MKKAICLLTTMLLLSPAGVMAKDGDEKKDGGNQEVSEDIVNDLPIDKEVSGTIYGSIYKENDDIIIDVPDKPNGNNDHNNNSNNNGNGSQEKPNGSQQQETPQSGNQAENNQADYNITPEGTDKKDVKIVYYKWERDKKTLEIYPVMFTKAKEEKKNIIMRVVDSENKALEYRLRIRYEDFKDVDVDTLKFEFGERCEHKKNIEELLISAEARSLLQCKQEGLSIPVYIGVRVPEAWDHSYGVYQYEFDHKEKELKLIRKDLQIDEENVVEILMEKEKDYVFYHHSLPVMKRSLTTWVSGLSGNVEIVDQGNAITSFVLFLTGTGLIGGVMYTILDRRRKKLKTEILSFDETEHEEKSGEE